MLQILLSTQRRRINARIVQCAERGGYHFLILVIGHAEPLRVGVQHADGQLSLFDQLADHVRQQALLLELALGQRMQERVEVVLQLREDPRRKA